MSATRPRTGPAKWDHGLRREALVQAMLADVFSGRLAAGQHLVGQDLADHYRVSQTPIREALITLAGIGVVDLLPNRGAVVRRMAEQDVREMCQLRRVLECEAVRTACGRVEPAVWAGIAVQIQQLQAKLGRAPGSQHVQLAMDLDSLLHDAIASACGNRLLAREIGRLKLLFRAYRDASWAVVAARNEFHRLETDSAEHLVLLGYLQSEDATAAVGSMAEHITSGEKYWTAVVFGHDKQDSAADGRG